MIVCSCNVISDHVVKEAACRRISWKELMHGTGLASNCGRCATHAHAIFVAAQSLDEGSEVSERPPWPLRQTELPDSLSESSTGSTGKQKE